MFFNKTTIITSALLAGTIAFGSAGTAIAAPGASAQAVQSSGPTVVDRFGANRFGSHTSTSRSTLTVTANAAGPTTENRFSGRAFSGQKKSATPAERGQLRTPEQTHRRAGVTTEQRFNGSSFKATGDNKSQRSPM